MKFILTVLNLWNDYFGAFPRRNGTIDIDEFGALWKYVQEWKGCFDRQVKSVTVHKKYQLTYTPTSPSYLSNRFDKDRSGNISPEELHEALSSFGYRLWVFILGSCIFMIGFNCYAPLGMLLNS